MKVSTSRLSFFINKLQNELENLYKAIRTLIQITVFGFFFFLKKLKIDRFVDEKQIDSLEEVETWKLQMRFNFIIKRCLTDVITFLFFYSNIK